MGKTNQASDISCSFCGKSQKEVKKIVAGPGVNICDECIALSAELAEDDPLEKDIELAENCLTDLQSQLNTISETMNRLKSVAMHGAKAIERAKDLAKKRYRQASVLSAREEESSVSSRSRLHPKRMKRHFSKRGKSAR